MRHGLRRPLLPLLFGFIIAGCGGAAASQVASTAGPTAGSTGPTGSGCSAAPAPPDHLPGWGSPATAPSVFPVLVNASGSLTCGSNRLLLTVLDNQNTPVAVPSRTLSLALYDLGRDGNTPTESETATFVWGIEGQRGFYVAKATFAEAGRWGAEITTALDGGAPEKIRMTFDVATSSPVVRVGEPAPPFDSPTADSVGGDLAKISTDATPDPAFYRTSVRTALANHEPFVLIFATPKFCVSAQCGPTLDRVKPLAAEFPTVDFIHVEPYELTFQNGSLQPVLDAGNNLQPIEAVDLWGILSEPWVFVVDRTGIVTASFEGVVSVDEIRAAANAVK
jgi:hypothetical protein